MVRSLEALLPAAGMSMVYVPEMRAGREGAAACPGLVFMLQGGDEPRLLTTSTAGQAAAIRAYRDRRWRLGVRLPPASAPDRQSPRRRSYVPG
ncbi:hypothetical protein, partial [Acrocarpospora phusangensis]|uniref:hypothetical protein n=1 Tax=Acrocarpospora phusangensis TaxID=1070424 RepID=UPI0019519BD3